jgi:hypothetical protein
MHPGPKGPGVLLTARLAVTAVYRQYRKKGILLLHAPERNAFPGGLRIFAPPYYRSK